ncbi:hypothetical protein ACFSKL_09855 [Belliella marina]|uniref:Uncharacterized protein n=1 Tax=Belliella marina TaxID=1644146 RepID=A0ABW4VN10_9BACT
MNIKIVCIFILAVLAGCQSEEVNKEGFDPPYFQLKEFVEGQATLLHGKKLIKEIQFDSSNERVEMIPTEEEWLEELDFFVQSDINKLSLVQAYEVVSDENEVVYSLKKGEKSKVKSLKIEFFENKKPSKIEFVIGSANTFYTTNTVGLLLVDEETNLVSKFEVNGKQKVVFLDHISMSLKGEISN